MSIRIEEVQVSPACKRLRSTWVCDCGCGTSEVNWSGTPSPAWIVVIGTKERRTQPDSPVFHFVDLEHVKTWARER